MERILNKLERRFGRYGVPGVTLGLISLQVIVYVISKPKPEILTGILLIPQLVMEGQVWRLVTFLAVPPVTNLIFAFFFWYLFYLMGTSLEHEWGVFRYNIYLVIGYIATVAVSFLIPDQPSSNAFLQGSVFLAFAFLNPDFQLYILFIIPVRIKWLALLTWIGYLYVLLFGAWLSKLLVLASICNYLLFFGQDMIERMKTGRRHMTAQAGRFKARPANEPFHRCTVCGITDLTDPDMDFRYCTQCAQSPGYCADHIDSHQHITVGPAEPGR